MASAVSAANRLLQLASMSGKPLTKLQLMKLLYMAHGFCLARTGQPLFPEQVEAWQYGPVIPSVYRATKAYGSEAISSPSLPEWMPSDAPLNLQQDEILKSVFNTYGDFSGVALSNLTHRPGSPWSQVWNPGSYHTPIRNELIRSHYQAIDRNGVVHSA